MKLVIKWGVIDAVLLLGLYGVYQDQLWRSTCEAASQCLSQVGSVSLSLLTMVTVLSSGGVPLQSAMTLDWIQVILVALVAVNTYFAFSWLRRRQGLPFA